MGRFWLVVVQGISHVTTQLVLLGVVLGRSSGNEYLVGLWFAVWLSAMAIGFVLGRPAATSEQAQARLFVLLLALAVLSPTLLIVLRGVLGWALPLGVTLNFIHVVLLTLLAVGPFAVLAGMTLNTSLALCPEPPWVRRVMVGDGLGDALGGLFAMLWLFLGFQPFALLVLVGALVAGHAVGFFSRGVKRWVGLGVVASLAFCLVASPLARQSLGWLVAGQRVLEHRASLSGEFLLTEAGGLRLLWQDGRIVAGTTTRESAEEFVHFSLAQPRVVSRVLLVGLPDRELLEELLRYPLLAIDCIEPEQAKIALWRREPTWPNEPRVRVIQDDLGRYARSSRQRYDLIFLDQPPPNTLVAASRYRPEYLRHAKRLLGPSGILSFRLGDYQNLMSEELAQLLGGIRGELRHVFGQVLILPTAPVVYLVSDGPLELTGRVQFPPRHGQARWLSEGTLRDLLAPERLAELASVESPAPSGDRGASLVARTLELDRARLRGALSPPLLVLATLALLVFFVRGRRPLVVGMLGFVTMGFQLLLLLQIQGVANAVLGPVLAIVPGFLLGSCLGGELQIRFRGWLRPRSALFALASTGLLVALAGGWMAELSLPWLTVLGFGVALVQGILGGLGFSGLLLRLPELSPGRLFGADLAGAAVGALTTSTVLLPLLGLGCTFVLLVGTTLIAGLVTRRNWA